MVSRVAKITTSTKIATAGSCFAQNIARSLRNAGFNFFIAEDCPDFISDEIANRHGYRVYSARYGNIYTLRQLVQLVTRSYGRFVPLEDYWEAAGRYYDPFRPSIQPFGYSDAAQLLQDRAQHFAAVKSIVEKAEVFIFTLGLTEAWEDSRDRAVFPVCPGCGQGTYDKNNHIYRNYDYNETLADGEEFIQIVHGLNASLKIIFTVSPVPLVATASSDHVLTATTYSKAVLRAVAGKLSSLHENVTYFPSFEIITGSYNRGCYFSDDLRTITPQGVNHVMKSFFRNFADIEIDPSIVRQRRALSLDERSMLNRMHLICDEEVLDKQTRIDR